MTDEQQMVAWNNLVMNAEPSKYDVGDDKRAASIVSLYMSGANNGGLNYFLTYSYDLDAQEVLASLETLGASIAAAQFRFVLDMIDDPLAESTEEARWDKLDDLWTDDLYNFDVLAKDADQDLADALTKHIEEYAEFYLQMTND